MSRSGVRIPFPAPPPEARAAVGTRAGPLDRDRRGLPTSLGVVLRERCKSVASLAGSDRADRAWSGRDRSGVHSGCSRSSSCWVSGSPRASATRTGGAQPRRVGPQRLPPRRRLHGVLGRRLGHVERPDRGQPSERGVGHHRLRAQPHHGRRAARRLPGPVGREHRLLPGLRRRGRERHEELPRERATIAATS